MSFLRELKPVDEILLFLFHPSDFLLMCPSRILLLDQLLGKVQLTQLTPCTFRHCASSFGGLQLIAHLQCSLCSCCGELLLLTLDLCLVDFPFLPLLGIGSCFLLQHFALYHHDPSLLVLPNIHDFKTKVHLHCLPSGLLSISRKALLLATLPNFNDLSSLCLSVSDLLSCLVFLCSQKSNAISKKDGILLCLPPRIVGIEQWELVLHLALRNALLEVRVHWRFAPGPVLHHKPSGPAAVQAMEQLKTYMN